MKKPIHMHRRSFLASSAAWAGLALLPSLARAQKRSPRILLRSSWQVVNIGDIAHTPGVLALIERHIPEAETVLWASGDLSVEVAAMEQRRFPKLKIVKGTLGATGRASNPELQSAIDWCDLLLHGSGPSLVAHRDVAAFVAATKKPFGIYGITYGGVGEAERQLMSQAQFAFFRDSVSLKKAKSDGVLAAVMDFAPDGAFACDLRDDAKAAAFLNAHGLEEGKFLCCLSRLRHTPYWTIPEKKAPFNPERQARNEAMKEHDHQPLRDAIIALVRETPLQVLLCPEDRTQMAVGRELFFDKLPADARARVVWRDKFWLTDEALSTYRRSAGLFGSEMHSPIMAVGNGVPAIVCRFAEQTSKGYMWRDIGLGEWLFDLDERADHARIVPAVLAMANDPVAAKAKSAQARLFVEQRQRETMAVLRHCLGV